MSEVVHPVTQVLEAYKAAVFRKDVDGFVQLYDHNVRVFDMWGEWSYAGVDAWRGMVTEWFGSLGTEQVVVEFQDVQMIVTHDLAFASAFITYQGISAEGEALRAMRNRITMVLAQADGTWKIVHEHSSAPIDFQTSKVILQQ